MQLASIEFARHVLGLKVHILRELNLIQNIRLLTLITRTKRCRRYRGTLRLGLYPCKLQEGTKAYAAYEDELIYESHRHRYEFNNEYREMMEAKGFVFSGTAQMAD